MPGQCAAGRFSVEPVAFVIEFLQTSPRGIKPRDNVILEEPEKSRPIVLSGPIGVVVTDDVDDG